MIIKSTLFNDHNLWRCWTASLIQVEPVENVFLKARLTWTEAEYFVTKNAVKNLFLSRYLSQNKTELEGSLVCICVIFIQFGETPQSPESSNVS